jgi:hypothetical protein
MTKDENLLYDRAKRLGYALQCTGGEYFLTAMDVSNGCVGGSDIEQIHRWLDQVERGSAA